MPYLYKEVVLDRVCERCGTEIGYEITEDREVGPILESVCLCAHTKEAMEPGVHYVREPAVEFPAPVCNECSNFIEDPVRCQKSWRASKEGNNYKCHFYQYDFLSKEEVMLC